MTPIRDNNSMAVWQRNMNASAFWVQNEDW